MKLTVIVPVYNAARYLERCLDSLLSQGMSEGDYEILCINDGSTDGSLAILNRYQQRHPMLVRVLTQENQGQWTTRNRGLDEARGEIVTCCDSDDYLIPGAYAYMLDRFWDDTVDLLRFLPMTLDRYVLKQWTETNDVTGRIEREGRGREVFQSPFFASMCTHFYRRSYLNRIGLRIPAMLMDEDRVFNLKLYMTNPRVRVCTSRVYRYTVNQNQTTTRREPTRMKRMLPDFITEFRLCNDYMSQCGEDEKSLSEYLQQRRYFRTSAFFSRMLSARLDCSEWRSCVNELKSIGWLPLPNGGKTALIIHGFTRSYSLYRMASFMFRNLFDPYILPHISRN